MPLTVDWNSFGEKIDEAELAPGLVRDFVQAIRRRDASAKFKEIRHDAAANQSVVLFDIEVQRPQRLSHPILRVEPIAVLTSPADVRPAVFSTREDFPDTPHQNWVPPGFPASLCVDDRPWAEAKLSFTASDFIWRIELWLHKAARGELHDESQPLDPIFLQGGDNLLMPASAFEDSVEPQELAGQYYPENPGYLIANPLSDAPKGAAGFAVVKYQVPPEAMPRMRYAPTTLGHLQAELITKHVDLFNDLKRRLRGWAGSDANNIRRLGERFAIVVLFPITADKRTANDVRAFLTAQTAGEIGVALGVLLKNVEGPGYSPSIIENNCTAETAKIMPAQVHMLFNREIAASISGHEKSDDRRVVLIGAGSLGSQLALNLAREGLFRWTVIDEDTLLPHNLARHGLLRNSLARPKAFALAHELGELLGEKVIGFRHNMLEAETDAPRDMQTALNEAKLFIDASASVAVSRQLADMPERPGRRISVFFNPSGTSAVLLAEDTARKIDLRDLEAQYYRRILTDETLSDHLQPVEGIRYSGSCRSLTNRIPATKAALLSALIARGIVEAASTEDSVISIWSAADDGGVSVVKSNAYKVFEVEAGDWIIRYDQGLLDQLSAQREEKLPNETGGVLLGVIDMKKKSVHILIGLSQPQDSKSSITEFERGIVALPADIEAAASKTMHQVRYVGEWHSHPKYASATPSPTDIKQLCWLGSELSNDGVPGLMLIAGHREDFRLAIIVASPANATGSERRSENGGPNATE